jgi:hypothetical protein
LSEDGKQAVGLEDPRNFILVRDLSEVFLLLDYLSSRPDTTIDALSTRQPSPDLDENWIQQICQVKWPPPDSNPQKADQAVVLIRARDYLNRLARPASGMTIAFTLMVTQKSGSIKLNPFKWFKSSKPKPRNPTLHEPAAQEPTSPGPKSQEPEEREPDPWDRSTFATAAFPDLENWAETFYKWIFITRLGVIAWLVVTCLLSWYVASGTSALADYGIARDKFDLAQKAVDDLEAGRQPAAVSAVVPSNSKAPETVAAEQAQTPTNTLKLEIGYCNRWEWVPSPSGQGREKGYQSADQLQSCRTLADAARRLELAENRQRTWLSWWCRVLRVGRYPGEAASAAAWLVSLLGTAVLPVCYGLLGAAAAVVRSLSQKIRSSTLEPRDLSLLIQQLALGAVIGSCIGLFFVGGDTTLIGKVTLSSSAISFVAGFGVDAVFQALEALISRIFNLTPAGAPSNNTGTPT